MQKMKDKFKETENTPVGARVSTLQANELGWVAV